MDSSADCIDLGITKPELLLLTRIDSFNYRSNKINGSE
jgi:hypothetical protein